MYFNAALVFSDNKFLILDGGNFIHNGKGVGITTNRIISDNKDFSVQQIKDLFQSKLSIQKLILVPEEPYDETGHIDGMVRFINETTVVVAQYPLEYYESENNITLKEYKEAQQTFNNVVSILESEGLLVKRITNDIPKTKKSNGADSKIGSAVGNYLNFLRIGRTVFIPQYNLTSDKVIEAYKTAYPELIFEPINNANKLADLGGVLNCISWTYY